MEENKALEQIIAGKLFDEIQKKYCVVERTLNDCYYSFCLKGNTGKNSYCFVEVNKNFRTKASMCLKYPKLYIDSFLSQNKIDLSESLLNYFEIYIKLLQMISDSYSKSYTESLMVLIYFFSLSRLFPSKKSSNFVDLFCQICKKYACVEHHRKQPKSVEFILLPIDYSPKIILNNWKGKFLHQYQKGPNSVLWTRSFKCKTHTTTPSAITEPLISELIPNPCAISLILNTPCTQHPVPLCTKKLDYPRSYSKFLSVFPHHNTSKNCSCKSCSENCPCVQGVVQGPNKKTFNFRGFCEVYCKCNLDCQFKFLGCDCSESCKTNECICYLNKTECDPWLCRRCCSLQDVKFNVDICGNVRYQKGLHKKLVVLAESLIQGAGIGVFADEDICKDEFIGEYTGELVSDQEANRRGKFFDIIQHSFLFQVDDIVSIDATFFGSKMRYVNHKRCDFANAETENWRVLGTTRVLVKAKEFISKGSEIYFDYKYPGDVFYEWYKEYNLSLGEFK